MRRFAERQSFRFDLAPAALWAAVSDTGAVDRDAGFAPARYAYEAREGGLSAAVGRARVGGLDLTWEEAPPSWEAPHRVAIERRFRGGPFARFASEVRVERDDGGGARLEHALELDARGVLGALLAPLVMARARNGATRAFALAARRASVPDVAPASIAHVTRFVDALEALRPHTEHEPEIAARLAAFVEHAGDAEVARMRPYALADAWDLPRERVLAAMLAAAHGGLLGLSWASVCPSCRVARSAVGSLARVGGEVRCEGCGLAYAADFDRNVEATFDARPSGRSVASVVYAVPGPQTARQTFAQSVVPAGATAALAVVLRPGAYVVQVLPDRAARFAVEDDAGSDVLDVRIDHARVRPAASVVQAGMVRIHLWNLAAREAVVRVSEAALSDQIATAAAVTALQAFRDLFPGEVLGEGVEAAIRSLTVVFTDVAGSTQLYADAGDARALRFVRGHAEALREVVALWRGAIVKTIGDAVMAVFADPRDAVEAALRFGAAVAPLQLRIGIHRGPCIAMCANGRLDYFGATVNVASRVAHAAGPGEVLLTTAVADDPRAELAAAGERGTVTLRGVPEPVDVVRLRGPAAPGR